MIDLKLVQQALRYRLLLALAIGSGVLGGGLTVGLAWNLSLVISQVFIEGSTLDQVWPRLVVLLGVIVARGGTSFVSELSARRLAVRIKFDLRRRLFSHLLDLGPAYSHGERTGELTATAVEGIEALDVYFSQYLPQVALAALIPLTILVSIFPLDPLSGIVLLVTAPLIPLFMVLIGRLADSLTRRQWQLLSRMSAHFLDILQGLKTLKALGRSAAQGESIKTFSERYAEITMSVLRVAFLSALVLELLATLSVAVVAVEIGLRLLYGRLVLVQALFILILAPEFYQPLRNLGARFHAGIEGVASAERIFTILHTRPIIPKTVAGPAAAPPTGNLVFENVRFTYPGAGQPALDGMTCEIPTERITALVGASGAGKTTVAHLILRFADPQEGEIRWGDRLLKEIQGADIRAQVAWVPQNPYLFHDTVAANIRFGQPEAGMEAVIHAAQQANLHAFIETLPQGYDTVIGERGTRLSGGEGQRLALARAFLKNSPFILLDEPAANLDPANETHLLDALSNLLRGRTALIIAHRLPTAMTADQILVLENGLLIEQGSHSQLMTQGGIYSRLVQTYGGAR